MELFQILIMLILSIHWVNSGCTQCPPDLFRCLTKLNQNFAEEIRHLDENCSTVAPETGLDK